MLLLLLLPLSLACHSDSCIDPALASLAAASETLGFQDFGINKLGSRLMAVFLPLIVCCSPHLLTFLVPMESSGYFSYASPSTPPLHCLWHFLNSSWLFCKGCHLKHPTVLIKLPEFINIHRVSRWPSSFPVSTSTLSLHCFYLCFHLYEILSSCPSFDNSVAWYITLLILSGWNHTKLCNEHMLPNK